MSKRDIQNLTQENYIAKVLDKKDLDIFKNLLPELKDSWSKRQIYRSEAEIRASVLNDASFPDNSSKYWQSVREQSIMFEALINMTFEYRENEIKIEKNKDLLKKENNSYDKKLLEIQLEKLLFLKASMELVAKDRIRELNLWSEIKKELDDGSFDNQNFGVDQLNSLIKKLNYKVKLFNKETTVEEKFNIVSVLQTAKKIKKIKKIKK
jgi:hypothetical protein